MICATNLQAPGHFTIKATPDDERQMQSLLDRGQVDGVIRVLPGFARDVARGRPATCRFCWTARIPILHRWFQATRRK